MELKLKECLRNMYSISEIEHLINQDFMNVHLQYHHTCYTAAYKNINREEKMHGL